MWFRIFLIIFFIGAGVSSKYAVFFVDEGNAVILTHFKKISRVVFSTGPSLKFPWEVIHTFTKRLESHEETLIGRSSDGLSIGFDITVFFQIDAMKLAEIYRELAKNHEELLRKIIVPITCDISRNSFAKFSTSDVYLKREEVAKTLRKDVQAALAQKYILLSDLQLKRIQLPESIEKAIENKLEKQHSVESLEFQKLSAFKESEIQEIRATGIAKAQKIISSTLSTQYLQKQAIEVYQKLAISSNKTFIVMPTNPKSTGIPLILSDQN